MDFNATLAGAYLRLLEYDALDALAAVRNTTWGKILCAALLWAFAVSTANHWTGLSADAVVLGALPSVLAIGGLLAWAFWRNRTQQGEEYGI